MANSYKIYTYTTGDAIFSIPFDYINKNHLFVFLDGTPTSEFTFLDSRTIRLNTPPAPGTVVGIYRLTPEDELLVKFKNTSDLSEDNLNTFQQQLFFLMQEKSDGLSTILGQGTDGNWDAAGKTIKNLPTPVDDGDPVRKVDIPALAVDGVGDLQTRMVAAEGDIDNLKGDIDNLELAVAANREQINELENTVIHNLFDFKWSDYLLNDESWLRSDTFSWHSGEVYENAYNHLLDDIQDKELIEKDVPLEKWSQPTNMTSNGVLGGSTFAVWQRETNRGDFYNCINGNATSGNFWHNEVNSGEFILYNPDPIIVKKITWIVYDGNRNPTNYTIQASNDGIGYVNIIENQTATPGSTTVMDLSNNDNAYKYYKLIVNAFNTGRGNCKILTIEALKAKIIQYYPADDGHKICPVSEESKLIEIYSTTGITWYYLIDTENQRFKLPRTKSTVQPPATEMYLYFYVGEFSQSASRQTAGLNAETFNGKADIDLSNTISNLSEAAKSHFTKLSLPANKVIALTLGASGTTYTAPTHGYFVLYTTYASGTNAYIDMYILGPSFGQRHYFAGTTNTQCRMTVPAQQGQILKIDYNGTLGVTDFRFIPAEGVKHLV